jgi:hypothetical protein
VVEGLRQQAQELVRIERFEHEVVGAAVTGRRIR